MTVHGDTLRVSNLHLAEVECPGESKLFAGPGRTFRAALLAGKEIAYRFVAGTLELRIGSDVMQFFIYDWEIRRPASHWSS